MSGLPSFHSVRLNVASLSKSASSEVGLYVADALPVLPGLAGVEDSADKRRRFFWRAAGRSAINAGVDTAASSLRARRFCLSVLPPAEDVEGAAAQMLSSCEMAAEVDASSEVLAAKDAVAVAVAVSVAMLAVLSEVRWLAVEMKSNSGSEQRGVASRRGRHPPETALPCSSTTRTQPGLHQRAQRAQANPHRLVDACLPART